MNEDSTTCTPLDDAPIACTLSAAELADRGRAWSRVLAFAVAREEVPDGMRITFDDVPGVTEALTRLVALEAECCRWMAMTLRPAPPTLHISASPGSVSAVRSIFG
ncbi:MAG TPA: hypothetical protein VFO60_10680 [Candidatus Dormibacteraeota bacterium]|nr:hypothetical protein [Candidatus Dormibacteraeota bacterium]